jgi:DNA polymerase I-like protein with 3'-5' exonuclease and polymerase domains
MDLALCLFDKALGGNPLDEKRLPTYTYKGKKVRRVGFFHDELQVECHPEVADEIGQLIVDCIKQAGVMLNMRIPLDGEYKIADNWAGTH